MSISSETRFAYPSTSENSPASTSTSARARSSEAMRTSAPSFAWASSFARSSDRPSRTRRESFWRRASRRMSSMTFLYSIASTYRWSLIASRALRRTISARPGSVPADRVSSITRSTDFTKSVAANSSPCVRARAISSVSAIAAGTSSKRPASNAASAWARACSAPRMEMSARERSVIVFRIAAIRARAVSCAFRRDSFACSEKTLRASLTFCSAARACSTASAYSARSKWASAVSRSETASSIRRPFSGATRPKVRLRLREVRGELTDVDALVVRVRDRRARSPQGVLGLSIQRDPHAFDEPLGRREEMFRLFQGAASDRLFGRREDVGRSGKVDVLGEQVRDLSAHGLHASMDSVRPLHPHPGVLGLGLSLGLEARARELLDLRDARLSRVDRVPVPGLGIGRLSVREHLLRRLEPDPVGPPTSDLAAGLPEGLCRGAPERFPCRGDVVLDAVEERVGLHQPAVLDRHRGVGEFPFEADRVVLTRLPQGDDVVPRLEDPDVQAFLRLRVLVRHPPVDQGLHVDRLAEVDRLVDFSEELASDLGIQSPRGVRQDDLQRILHDGPEMRVPHAFRRMPRRGDQTASRADILALDGSSQLNERLLEPGDVGAEVLQVVPIHLEAGERVPDGLDEGRLADGIMGVVGEALDLTEILRRHRDLGLVQDDLRPSHVGPLPFLPARLPSDLPEGRLRGRDPPGLAQAVPRLLGEEGDVSEDAAADRVAGLGEELAGLGDVDPFVPSEVHLGRGAVEEPFQPGPSRLRVCGLHRLGGERPDLSVLPDREGLAGLLEEGLGIADGPSPFLRVPDAGLGLFQTRVEGVLPAFVEARERRPFH